MLTFSRCNQWKVVISNTRILRSSNIFYWIPLDIQLNKILYCFIQLYSIPFFYSVFYSFLFLLWPSSLDGPWSWRHLFIFSVIISMKRQERTCLPWEHLIGCQMCKVVLTKSTDKVLKKYHFLIFFYTEKVPGKY